MRRQAAPDCEIRVREQAEHAKVINATPTQCVATVTASAALAIAKICSAVFYMLHESHPVHFIRVNCYLKVEE